MDREAPEAKDGLNVANRPALSPAAIAGQISLLERLTGSRRTMAAQAARAVAPLVRSMILANVDAAGIGRDTGTLRKHVARVETRLGKDSRSIVWFWPSGLKGYDGKNGAKGQPNFYAVANALNYGWVRAQKSFRFVADLPNHAIATYRYGPKKGQQVYERRDVIGARAKKTLKKLAAGQKITGRAREAVRRGTTGRKGGLAGLTLSAAVDLNERKDRARSVSIGGHSIMHARGFFQLSSAQKTRLAEAFNAELARLVRAQLKRA